MKEAMYYKTEDGKRVRCLLCPHRCIIDDGGLGICRARKNDGGRLYSLNYNRLSSIAMDPIEKKPLYHFYPGSHILSVGTFGCNFRCSFCQNYQISQQDPEMEDITAERLVEIARSRSDSIGIAYTYNEPSIWYEFVYESAKLAREAGLQSVLVTNGYISEEPLKQLLPYIDAMNIDVKGFNDRYYRNICGGRIEPVKRTVEIASSSCHVEITTLLVTGLNDGIEEIRALAEWLSSISRDIPLHLTRYFPNYQLDREPTPVKTLVAAADEARRFLHYVYIGNLWGGDRTTYCPKCGKPLIDREGSVVMRGMADGRCAYCGERIAVVYQK